MVRSLLVVAALLQLLAVAYGLYLLTRRRGAVGAWLCLLGAMLSMLAWRCVVLLGIEPPGYFNPLIAIWGSTCMVAAMFLFGREVKARHAAEIERDALLDSERAARAEAERASRTKDEFLATLSHELRTPLAAILGWCAVLRARGQDAETAGALQVVERNARAQARLVDDLLDVTRMHAGRLHLERELVALDGPVRSAVESILPAAGARRVRVVAECEGATPHVIGDVDRLRQVVANLVGNAVKFTAAGGTVRVSLRRTPDAAELVVADDGEGIDPAFLPHVFARFRQADGSAARVHGGLGLGLSIVQHLVQLHGGAVRAASDGHGRGATFTVTLPLAPGTVDVDVPVASSPWPGDPADAEPLTGLHVVVVDDELDVRAAVAKLLESAGARVTVLASGEDLADVLARHRPHAMLVDIGMPREDGYSLLKRIRRLPAAAGGGTPAISLTAHARSEDRARALATGFQAHLPKPVDVPQLVSTLRAVAADAQTRRAVAEA